MPFTRDVQDFMKELFLSGQTELAGQTDATTNITDPQEEGSAHQKCPPINTYKLNVQANAACVDLLVWASADESGK